MRPRKTTRREFLTISAMAGVGLLLPVGCSLGGTSNEEQTSGPISGDTLRKFAQPLPIPDVLDGTKSIAMSLEKFAQQLHPDLPPTTLYGYTVNGKSTYPGPTIEAVKGTLATITQTNNLPTTHILPLEDHSIPRPGRSGRQPVGDSVITHLHGGHTPAGSDGGPDDWFTSGESYTYDYPNIQNATTLWYHDHTMSITRVNVFAGLAGFYLLRDPKGEGDDGQGGFGLPFGKYEVPLLIQDRSFNSDGSLVYPSPNPNPFWDTVVVNGAVWPLHQVDRAAYRLRILNGSNHRTYTLSFDSGQPFRLIGTDGGLLPASLPAPLSEITLGPAERADVVVDFSTVPAGTQVILKNSAEALEGNPQIDEVMAFDVNPAKGPPAAIDTANWPAFTKLDPAEASQKRDFTLQKADPEKSHSSSNPWLIGTGDRQPTTPDDMWTGKLAADPVLGSTEVWSFINPSQEDSHPIHLHLVQFQILGRRTLTDGSAPPFDPTNPTDLAALTPPAPEESGWKDTVMANTDEVVHIIAKFEDFMGEYPFHCHTLEHEDNDMMRAYRVIDP